MNTRQYSARDGLRLPIGTRDVQIDYTALSLSIPERVQFRFRLDGADRDWHEAGARRQAFYTSLRPGAYRFRVIAANSDGVWNDAGATVQFAILPAFYQTSWFFALSAAMGATAIWGVYRLRMRIVERHQAEITALNERLMNAQEQERTRITGELHDGAMQRISALNLMLGAAKRQLPADLPARTAIGEVQQRLIQVGSEIRQMSHGLHPPILKESGLPEALRGYCDEFARVRGIPVACEADERVRELSAGTSPALYRIAQEALGNAAKHAAPTRIDVRLTRANGDVVLTVADDGAGCDPSRIGSNGLGLVNMRERARQLNGTFGFDTKPGHGTTVRVAIPFCGSLVSTSSMGSP